MSRRVYAPLRRATVRNSVERIENAIALLEYPVSVTAMYHGTRRPACILAAGDLHNLITTRPTHAHSITHDLAILAGKPVITGIRNSVAVILEYLAHPPTSTSSSPTIHA
jgi:hypothetical protein